MPPKKQLVKSHKRTPKAMTVHVDTYVRTFKPRGKTKTVAQRQQAQSARNTERVRRIEEGLRAK